MAKTPKAITDMSTLARVIFDPDTVPPSVPTGVAGIATSSTRIDLSWSASTDTGGSGLTGYLVYRGSSQIAQVGATSLSYSDTGLLPSTPYQYQIAALDGAGNLSGKSTVISVTTQAAPTGPPVVSWAYPIAALVGQGGIQDYPSTAWSTYAKHNTMFMGGYWEGHTSLNRQAAVTGIKAASTLPIKTLVFQYMSLNQIDTSANGVAYSLWRSEVQTRNWLCYLVRTTGSPLPSLDGPPTQEVLYTDYAGTNPSLEYPYEFGAKYCYNAVLTTTREVRFTSLSTNLVATNLDGLLQDNFLCDPGLDGDFNRDGVTETHGSPTVITPWLQAGQLRYCNQMRALAPTKYVMANYGGGYGDAGTASAGVMQSQLDGGVCESFIGKDWSRDTWQGFVPMMAAYYKALDIAKNPQMVVFQGSWPDTASDGSALIRRGSPGHPSDGFPPVYTLPQYSRYIAGCAYVGGGQSAINKFSTGYSSNLADIVWPEEYDQAGAAALGWLGNPLTGTNGARPTGPRFKGMWVREFDNGAIVVSPSGNTTQTFTSTDLPGNFKTFAGTGVNDGTVFTSITMGERDARFLVRVASTSNPLSLPLTNNAGSLFTYLGRFNVPSTFQFGGAGIGVLNGVMYVSGLQNSNASLGSVQLPTKAQIQAGGSSATTIKAPVSVPGNVGQGGANASFSLSVGSAQYLGNLYINLGIFYAAGSPQTGWLVQANTGLTTFGTPQGMSPTVGGTLLSNFNGNIGYVPSLWQPVLGGPLFVAGGIGLGIVSTLCCGFGLSTFDPANVKITSNNVPVNQWLNYPYGGSSDGAGNAFNTTSLWNRPNVTGSISGNVLTVTAVNITGTVINAGATVQWSGGQTTISSRGTGTGGAGTYNLAGSFTAASTGLWISNTAVSPVNGVATGGNDLAAEYDGALGTPIWFPGYRTIAFLSTRHYGPTFANQSNSACDSGASGSRDPRRLQLTLYDLQAIVTAKQNSQPLSSVLPYQFETFPNAQSLYGTCPGILAEGCYNGTFAVDPVTNIMYGSANGMGGSTWFMDAWQIGSGPPPAPAYSTTFPSVQNPLSESGNWYNNGAPTNGFTRCVVSAVGQCNGTSTGVVTGSNPGGYDDSYALVRGFELYPQQFVQFTVKMRAGIPQDGHSREVEGRLWCSQDNSGGLVGLEVDLQYNDQSVPVVWWTGAPGSFAEAVTGLSLPQPLANGQIIRIQITSSGVVSGTQNGVSMGSVNILTDNNLKNIVKVGGNPGVGFFIRPGASPTDVGISAFSCGTF